MPGFDIGLSGLNLARRAIEVIGTNIANASTDGYHRQTVQAKPVDYGSGPNASMGGVAIAGITQSVDVMLENEILRQRPASGQLTQELQTLQTIEQSLGTLDSQGLSNSLTSLFSGLRQLAGQPDSAAYQEQAASALDQVAGQFRDLGQFLDDLKSQFRLEAQNQVEKVNGLSQQIADLNKQIQSAENRGEGANVLKDQRDKALSDLGDLVDVQADSQGDTGMTNVSAWGIPLVTGGQVTQIETGQGADGTLGVTIKGVDFLHDVRGGQIGGLLSLHNDLVDGIQGQLDTLAKQIVDKLNEIQVQGVGTAGSFTELTGVPVASDTLSDWNADLTAGQFFIRVTNTGTGQVSRVGIAVDPANSSYDTMSEIASQITAVQGLSAYTAGNQLHIQADAGYKFDFVPALLPNPTSSTLAVGTSRPTISGTYSGVANQDYTFKMLGDGTVGLTTGLSVEVKNGAGQVVKTLSVGAGYAAGDPLEVADGISVAFGAGTTKTGETFTVAALADSDPTGFLAAAGMNTLLQGDSARSITVRNDILTSPDRIATARGGDLTDALNISRMAELANQPLDELGHKSIVDYYSQVVSGLGQNISVRQARKTSTDSLMQQLQNQKDQISGVDINTEAASLMEYEKMFQASAKYLSTLDQTLQTLINMT